jgi:tetratricopeptide (TPR) repeat protein
MTSKLSLESKVANAIHESKFADAKNLVGESQNPNLLFLKAYSLYRLERLVDALPVLDAAGPSAPHPAALHLRAQILYRIGNYDECIPLYEDELKRLRNDSDSDPQDTWDAQMNLAASLVSAGRSTDLLQHELLRDVVSETVRGQAVTNDLPYELIFNISCALLDAGRSSDSARALEQALIVGSRFLDGHDASVTDVVAASVGTIKELAPVRAQAALLLQAAHFDKAAGAIYSQFGGNSVKSAKSSGSSSGDTADQATLAVVSNNQAITQSSSRDTAATLKRINMALASASAAKLTIRQMLTLRLNLSLLLLQQRKLDDCDRELTEVFKLLSGKEAISIKEGRSVPVYVKDLVAQAKTAKISLDHQRKLLSGNMTPREVSSSTKSELKSLLGKSLSSTLTPLPPQEGLLLQLCISEGNYLEAAQRLSGYDATPDATPMHPARASTVAQLFLAAKEGVGSSAIDAAEAVLTNCVNGWTKRVSTESLHSINVAVEALFSRAGFYAAVKNLGKAITDFETVLNLKGISKEKRSAALASIALIKVEQSANEGGASLAAESEKLIAEALALSPNADTASNLKDLKAEKVKRIDELEFPPSSALELQRKAAAAAAAAFSANVKKDEVAEAALAKRRMELKRIKAKKQRAKRRAKYIAKIVASGRFSLTGLPTPQSDRWFPKKERERIRKGGSKAVKNNAGKGAYVGAGAHQGGSDAAIERSLDVRAKIEAKSKTGVDKKSSAQALSESKAAELADAAAKKAAAAAAAAASKKGKK